MMKIMYFIVQLAISFALLTAVLGFIALGKKLIWVIMGW